MRDVNLDQMSNQYFDVLKEIGNIGAGNAMTALSQMLQCKVDMKVPQVRLLEFSEVGALMGGEEQIMAAVLLGVEGDITGYMMFMAEEQGARHLIGKITGGMLPEGSEFEEMGMSALQEVGNIIICSYVNAFTQLVGVEIDLSVPSSTVNMLGGVLTVPMAEYGYVTDKLMYINAEFIVDGKKLSDGLLMLPDIESLNRILEKLGVS